MSKVEKYVVTPVCHALPCPPHNSPFNYTPPRRQPIPAHPNPTSMEQVVLSRVCPSPSHSRLLSRSQFAINYVEANPNDLDHVDTAQILAFSLVMLNVDAHNDNIKKVLYATPPTRWFPLPRKLSC